VRETRTETERRDVTRTERRRRGDGGVIPERRIAHVQEEMTKMMMGIVIITVSVAERIESRIIREKPRKLTTSKKPIN